MPCSPFVCSPFIDTTPTWSATQDKARAFSGVVLADTRLEWTRLFFFAVQGDFVKHYIVMWVYGLCAKYVCVSAGGRSLEVKARVLGHGRSFLIRLPVQFWLQMQHLLTACVIPLSPSCIQYDNSECSLPPLAALSPFFPLTSSPPLYGTLSWEKRF